MRIIPRTLNGSVLVRAIGSKDYRGKGTLHPIADVNPFCFLEHLVKPIENKGVPGFGLHPHSGVSVLTIALSGTIENVVIGKDGKEKKEIHGGSGPFLVATNAGRGIVHDEHTYTAEPCDLVQCALLTGDNTSESYISYVEKPTILRQSDESEIMICSGTFRGEDSRLKIGKKGAGGSESGSVPVLLYVTLPPGGVFELNEQDMKGCNAFVYNMKRLADGESGSDEYGSLVVNNDKQLKPWHLAVTQQDDNEQDNSDVRQLKIENRGSTEHTSAFVGFGKPITPAWTKLLMFDGFVFAPSKEDAEKKEQEFEQVGASGFGHSSTK